jgi:hypothetical protein
MVNNVKQDLPTCSWDGICCRNWSVVTLNLTCGDACKEPLSDLSQTFLSSLQSLNALEYFSLRQNSVSGQLLDYSGGITSLQNLQVRSQSKQWQGLNRVLREGA